MEQKRKISVRKVLQVLLTLVVSVGCVIAISGASNKEIRKTLTGVEVHIKNNKHKFVDEAQIKKELLGSTNVKHLALNTVNTAAMEQKIKNIPWVANAQIYVDNKKVLHVNVTQRVPVARIFEESGKSYYIDGTLSIMPTCDRYVYYTTIVTGVPPIIDNKLNDSANKSLMSQITYLVKRIERDSFWNAQVSQIVMSTDRSFEIVPVLGNQRIILGDTSRLDEKLDNLFAFYKKILTRVGWDKYDVLDLRYKGQVVASPVLEWKKPAGAINELQWVETIKSKASYNKNVFTLDSNNNAVINKAVAPVQAVAVPVRTLVVNDAPAKKPAEPAAKPVAKPAVKPVVKIGPPEDKPVKKEVAQKPVAKAKVVAKPAAKPKVTPAASKKVTKKPPVKKEPVKKAQAKATDKKKEVNKKKVDKAKENKSTPKYLYNNH